MLQSLISKSVLPDGHSRQCFPTLSGRKVSQSCRNRFGYIFHSLFCLHAKQLCSWQMPPVLFFCLAHPRLAPSFYNIYGFMEWVVLIFHTALTYCFGLNHFPFGFHWQCLKLLNTSDLPRVPPAMLQQSSAVNMLFQWIFKKCSVKSKSLIQTHLRQDGSESVPDNSDAIQKRKA